MRSGFLRTWRRTEETVDPNSPSSFQHANQHNRGVYHQPHLHHHPHNHTLNSNGTSLRGFHHLNHSSNHGSGEHAITPIQHNSETIPTNGDDNAKIAFLFLSRDYLPLEDLWQAFFEEHDNPNHYTIYWHTHREYKPLPSSFFYGKQIPNMIETRWGDRTLVDAARLMIIEALKDPLNQFFILLSESCMPIHPMSTFRKGLLNQPKSIVNACAFEMKEMEGDTRWTSKMTQANFNKSYWRKSSEWFGLIRHHAELYGNDTYVIDVMSDVRPLDEHYLATLLAYHHQDDFTTCSDGLSHVFWRSLRDAHPMSYTGAEFQTPDLIHKMRQGMKHASEIFNGRCSGIEGLCHFTARKIRSDARIQLLHHLDWVLTDDHFPTMKKVPDVEKLAAAHIRYENSTDKYYYQENRVLLEIPKVDYLPYFQVHDKSLAVPLSEEDKTNQGLKVAPNKLWFFEDGLFVKVHYQASIWKIENGTRRVFPDWPTFVKLAKDLSNVKSISEGELGYIPIGPMLASLKD